MERIPVGGVQPVAAGPVLDPRVPIDRIDPIWRIPIRLPDLGDLAVPPPAQIEPEHSFEVIRSADLVSLTVSTSGFDLADGVLTARDPGPGLLIYSFPFQHLGEKAYYEGLPSPVPNPLHPDQPPQTSSGGVETPDSPVPGIPARGSRVVVAAPAGATVEVSTAGFLDALSRYPMAVHPLATPGPARGLVFFDPGLLVVLRNAGLLAAADGDDQPAAHAVELQPAGTTFATAQVARTLAQLRRTLGTVEARASVGDLVSDWRVPGRIVGPILRNPQKLSRPAGAGETAIEAPFRLTISPSTSSGWTHADAPVPDASGSAVELWHTRLGHRGDDTVVEGEIEAGKVYEERDFNKIIEIRERERARVRLLMDMIDQNQKTLVFCANQAHALVIRDLINEMKTSTSPDYCHRVTADDGGLVGQTPGDLRAGLDDDRTGGSAQQGRAAALDA